LEDFEDIKGGLGHFSWGPGRSREAQETPEWESQEILGIGAISKEWAQSPRNLYEFHRNSYQFL